MKVSAKTHGTVTVAPESPTDIRDIPRRIQITDGSLSLVAKGFGRLEQVNLPAGVYQARVESASDPFEQMIYVPPGGEVSVTYPVATREVLSSAAPVPGADAMHEYIRAPLDAALAAPSHRASRILVMATRSGVGAPIDFSRVRLRDGKGKEVAAFEANSTAGSQNEWKMSRHDVDEGGWVLEVSALEFGLGKVIRQPIWCSNGWSTLIFVAADSASRTPDFGKASIYLWRMGESFAPEQSGKDADATSAVLQSQRYTELALRSLVNGRSLLSIKEVDANLLVKKFSNPMLGLLGCHLLLQQTARDNVLVKIVLRNLNALIPGHPDLRALEVMARKSGVKGLQNPISPISWPPMLLSAFMALRNEDWQSPGVIESGSVCDRVRTRVLSGGVWNRWVGDAFGAEFIKETTSKTRPFSVEQSFLARTFPSTTKKLLAYAKRFSGEAKLHADDLRWTGLSRPQADAALQLIEGETTRQSRVGRKTAARSPGDKGFQSKAQRASKQSPAVRSVEKISAAKAAGNKRQQAH
jgi:hypothetical protein